MTEKSSTPKKALSKVETAIAKRENARQTEKSATPKKEPATS